MRISWRPFLLALALALLAPRVADAFCGFYVSGAGAKLFNNATVVVLMREGTRTVLSMQNNYQGPPESFAMVVPVPVVLQKDNVKTLPREIFERVDTLAAPRLVEYWEQDPCNPDTLRVEKGGRQLVVITSNEIKIGGVKIEAQFTVGEYEVVILSANDSLGLDKWLRSENYKIPEGAEPFLRPYVQAGMKFFVAKVNPAKVKFENGSARLSPLRFHYDAETFSLPVRLGLMNSAGTQDLLVHIIAKGQRYEVANYPNVAIPTNIDVAEDVKRGFGAFYAALFDRTLEKNPRSVVTEYAWTVGKCDPCPGPVPYGLTPPDILTLGADALPSVASTFRTEVGLAGAPQVNPSAAGYDLYGPLRGSLRSALASCYEQSLKGKTEPARGVELTLTLTVGRGGKASGVSVKGAPGSSAKLQQCAASAVRAATWPEPPAHPGKLSVMIPLTLFRTSSFSHADYVLTRLHARYEKDSLGEDLVFRAAPPIIGGNEVRNASGKLDHGAISSGYNGFQGRYAIRHPWTGPIACEKPTRGVWGPPPGQGFVIPQPATNIAFAPRGGVTLVSLLKEDVPEIGVSIPAAAAPLLSPPILEPDTASSASQAPKPAASSQTAPPSAAPPSAGGCAACSVLSQRSAGEPWSRGEGTQDGEVAKLAAWAAILGAALRRRRAS